MNFSKILVWDSGDTTVSERDNICFRLSEDTRPSPTSEWFARTKKRTVARMKSSAGTTTICIFPEFVYFLKFDSS